MKTVYIPTKVENELPELDKQVFTLNTMMPDRVQYPPKDDGENICINRRVSEIPNKCEKWYDENNFGFLYSKVHTWLKPTEAYVFTPEELKQLLEDYTQKIAENAEIHSEFFDEESNLPIYQVNRKSITSQLETFLKEI